MITLCMLKLYVTVIISVGCGTDRSKMDTENVSTCMREYFYRSAAAML